ncbi:acyl-CoA dehydrogenase [Saccharothrix sp. NRRL B-16348]|jgi:alkylation response protein AidB-like acyl-CoA dehydrogenase|uniref:acyl-CoA dehydrogenase family protein n=1 Tax=Saccharothrix sp. NRRL B-16348 TaxID=1415542 RepID=UPI0006AE7224|nr:acyl-CoA dehydrogenase family protein [Saccharothrix sp. NRRL B-16348]KOX23494.1 acyl-CoA dehydrogenase [Saccharothrix sp. NRRL B-16348]
MTTAEKEFVDVLDAVKSIVPTLRENGQLAEQQRWIPDENLQLLDKAGVFRLVTERRHGGLDASIAQQCAVLAEIGRGCPSTAWVSTVWLASSWVARGHSAQAKEEIWSTPSVRVSGVFSPFPTATLTPVDGGYLLNGFWKFNTGCRGADWNGMSATLTLPDGTTEEMATIVPIGEFEFADDWNVSSVAATGSSTTTAKDIFVPAHRVQKLHVLLEGADSRSEPGKTDRNYSLGEFAVAQAVGTFIGIAKGALELFMERLPGRGIAYTAWTEQSKHPFTQIQVGTVSAKIAAAEGLSAGVNELVQRRADEGVELTALEKGKVRGDSAYAMQLAREAVEILYNASGATGIQLSVPLQRFHRDIQGLSLHGLGLLSTNMEIYGRAVLGLDADGAF